MKSNQFLSFPRARESMDPGLAMHHFVLHGTRDDDPLWNEASMLRHSHV